MELSRNCAFALLLAGSSLAMPVAAQTGSWQVTTEADAYANGSGGGGAFNVTDLKYACNGIAPYCSGPTPGPGAPPVTYMHSDTQTFSKLTANASGSYPAGMGNNPGGSAAGTAYAYADLATGELHIADSGTSNGYASTVHRAQAGFQDTLSFTGLTGLTNFTVHVHLDGTFLGYNQPNLSFSMSNDDSYLILYQDWGDISTTVPACIGIPGCANVAVQPANTTLSPSGSWTKLGEGDYIGVLTADPLHRSFSLGMNVSAGSDGTGFDDFSNTAGITFDLPKGVSFTSASGVFLTAQDEVAAVPEPATWAMMIGGLVLVGGAMRRRRGTVAIA